jgi:hypothetical protein
MTSAAVPLPAVAGSRHNTLREGAIVGFIGATGVALWLLIVDVAEGRPFYTPSTLGYGLFTLFAAVPANAAASVLFYTFFHYAAFAVIGVALVSAIHGARAHPSIFALMLMLFACFQLGFYGLVAIIAESRLGDLAWYQVGIANLIATALMGTYLWRTHPAIARVFGSGMVGDELSDGDRELIDSRR